MHYGCQSANHSRLDFQVDNIIIYENRCYIEFAAKVERFEEPVIYDDIASDLFYSAAATS
jgi:hypothetical protein